MRVGWASTGPVPPVWWAHTAHTSRVPGSLAACAPPSSVHLVAAHLGLDTKAGAPLAFGVQGRRSGGPSTTIYFSASHLAGTLGTPLSSIQRGAAPTRVFLHDLLSGGRSSLGASFLSRTNLRPRAVRDGSRGRIRCSSEQGQPCRSTLGRTGPSGGGCADRFSPSVVIR